MGRALGRAQVPRSNAWFAVLQGLDQRCRQRAVGLPQEEEPEDIWAGILYFVGKISFLSALSDIAEVLNIPQGITPVPGTTHWVHGLINHRGTLLPVFDLRAFLFQAQTAPSAKNRILVVRQSESPFGLLVGDVVGIRHLESSARMAEAPKLGESVDRLVSGSFRIGIERKAVFDLQALAQDSRFNQVVEQKV